jgi:hypothetical protein
MEHPPPFHSGGNRFWKPGSHLVHRGLQAAGKTCNSGNFPPPVFGQGKNEVPGKALPDAEVDCDIKQSLLQAAPAGGCGTVGGNTPRVS